MRVAVLFLVKNPTSNLLFLAMVRFLIVSNGYIAKWIQVEMVKVVMSSCLNRVYFLTSGIYKFGAFCKMNDFRTRSLNWGSSYIYICININNGYLIFYLPFFIIPNHLCKLQLFLILMQLWWQNILSNFNIYQFSSFYI